MGALLQGGRGSVIIKDGVALVKVSVGLTCSQDYQSARLDVGVEIPVRADKIEQGFKEAREIVEKHIQVQAQDLPEAVKELASRVGKVR